eukprot:1158431-Pelagomonas_calceolata.AAC.1
MLYFTPSHLLRARASCAPLACTCMPATPEPRARAFPSPLFRRLSRARHFRWSGAEGGSLYVQEIQALPPRKQVLEVDGDIGQVQKRDQVAFGSEEWRRRLFIFSDKLLSLYKAGLLQNADVLRAHALPVADCDSEEQVVEWLRCREASVQPSLTICNIRLPDGSKAEVSMRKLAQAYGFEVCLSRAVTDDLGNFWSTISWACNGPLGTCLQARVLCKRRRQVKLVSAILL